MQRIFAHVNDGVGPVEVKGSSSDMFELDFTEGVSHLRRVGRGYSISKNK